MAWWHRHEHDERIAIGGVEHNHRHLGIVPVHCETGFGTDSAAGAFWPIRPDGAAPQAQPIAGPPRGDCRHCRGGGADKAGRCWICNVYPLRPEADRQQLILARRSAGRRRGRWLRLTR
jgi:hypothetical protein